MLFTDFHVHLGAWSDSFRKKLIDQFPSITIPRSPLKWEKYAALADRHSVGKAVIFPMPADDARIERENDYILESVRRRQDLFVGVTLAGLPLSYYQKYGALIRGCKDEFYLQINRDNDSSYHRLLQWLEKTGRFFVIHPKNTNKTHVIKYLAEKYPTLRIVLAHSGRESLYTGRGVIEKIVPLVRPLPNVFLETSTIRDSVTFEELVRKFPVERIIYGSDYPFDLKNTSSNSFYDRDLSYYSSLDDYHKKCILCLNSRKLYVKDIEVRKCSSEDRGVLRHMISSMSDKEKDLLAYNAKRPQILSAIRTCRHIVIIEYKGNIAGFLRESGRPNNSSFIEELYVHPDYRGKGLATELLRYAMLRYSHIELKTYNDNVRMIRVLRALGMKTSVVGKLITKWTT